MGVAEVLVGVFLAEGLVYAVAQSWRFLALFEWPPEAIPPEMTLTTGEQVDNLEKENFRFRGRSRGSSIEFFA